MWTKFKHWLIRKLGGYVAPCIKCPRYTQTLIKTMRPINTLQAIYCVDVVNNIDPNIQMGIAKGYIFNEIVTGIKDSDYIKYELGDDRILRGTLMVVKQV